MPVHLICARGRFMSGYGCHTAGVKYLMAEMPTDKECGKDGCSSIHRCQEEYAPG